MPDTAAPRPEPFTLRTALADLRSRLRATRRPAQEAALARLPHFRVRLGGFGIHFVHARAVAPVGPVLPLVLSHGRPDSFWRGTKVIPLGYRRFGAAGGDIGRPRQPVPHAGPSGPGGGRPADLHRRPGGAVRRAARLDAGRGGVIVRPPRAWLERTATVVRVSEPARGGHFAPFEEPELRESRLYRTAAR